MIKLALFDVGETLLSGGAPLPHARAALESIAKLARADGEPLRLGVASDFKIADPLASEAAIAALEAEFLEILRTAELAEFFAPLDAAITLSCRARVWKPDRRFFEVATARSGNGAALDECLFVSEYAPHLEACRGYGMTVVRFGAGPGLTPCFASWADAPALLGGLIAPPPVATLPADPPSAHPTPPTS